MHIKGKIAKLKLLFNVKLSSCPKSLKLLILILRRWSERACEGVDIRGSVIYMCVCVCTGLESMAAECKLFWEKEEEEKKKTGQRASTRALGRHSGGEQAPACSEVSGGLGGQSLDATGVTIFAEDVSVQRVASLVVPLWQQRAAVLRDAQAPSVYSHIVSCAHCYSKPRPNMTRWYHDTRVNVDQDFSLINWISVSILNI